MFVTGEMGIEEMVDALNDEYHEEREADDENYERDEDPFENEEAVLDALRKLMREMKTKLDEKAKA